MAALMLVSACAGGSDTVRSGQAAPTAADTTGDVAASSSIEATAGAGLTDVLGTMGSLVYEPELRADGQRHLNTPRMIDALTALHANTYVFPMTDRTTNWPDLRDEFLPAAAEAGIDVWVLLYAPSEPVCCSPPFGTDYVRWAREIATVSVDHPNLTAWMIDDYAYDLGTFTPSYVGRMQSTAKAINPALALVPVVYFAQYSSSFVNEHAPLVDGMVFPFWDEPSRNTSWTWNLSYQVRTVAARLGPHGTPLFLMPYAHPLSHAMQPPTVEYVQTLTARGLELLNAGEIAGVVQYKLPLVPQHASWTRPESDNLARTGNGRLSFVVEPNTTTTSGMWCGASRTIQPDATAARQQVSFWHRDNRGPTDLAGYHSLQLLVDGRVVWEQDVISGQRNQWQRTTVDVTGRLAGKATATLQWRLLERRGVSNLWVDVGIDDIETSGFELSDPGVETAASWNPGLARQAAPLYCSAQIYHPNYGADVVAAVTQLYGSR